MSLNVNAITSGLVKLTKELIPNRLSTSPGPNNTTVPSVILNRSQAPKPDFPYVVCDHVGIQKQGLAQKESYLDDDDNQVDEFEYLIRLSWSVHASTNQDAIGIAEEMRSRMLLSQNLERLETLMNASLLNISDISFIPTLMSTDFEEVARFVVDVLAISTITDPSPYLIENVSVDGELYEDFDQTDPPLTTQTQVGPLYN